MEDSIDIEKCKKLREGIFFSKINENNFQTKKTDAVFDNNKIDITLTGEEISRVNKIHNSIIELTSKNSEDWFGKKISIENCKKIFNNALSDNKLRCFYDSEIKFFSKNIDQIERESLKDTIKGIALIKCDGVVFTKTYFFVKWKLLQFKIKNETEYLIKDLEEHSLSLSDELDKIEDITLF